MATESPANCAKAIPGHYAQTMPPKLLVVLANGWFAKVDLTLWRVGLLETGPRDIIEWTDNPPLANVSHSGQFRIRLGELACPNQTVGQSQPRGCLQLRHCSF